MSPRPFSPPPPPNTHTHTHLSLWHQLNPLYSLFWKWSLLTTWTRGHILYSTFSPFPNLIISFSLLLFNTKGLTFLPINISSCSREPTHRIRFDDFIWLFFWKITQFPRSTMSPTRRRIHFLISPLFSSSLLLFIDPNEDILEGGGGGECVFALLLMRPHPYPPTPLLPAPPMIPSRLSGRGAGPPDWLSDEMMTLLWEAIPKWEVIRQRLHPPRTATPSTPPQMMIDSLETDRRKHPLIFFISKIFIYSCIQGFNLYPAILRMGEGVVLYIYIYI